MSKNSDGLRERKRQETRQALEVAAIELVSASGLEATTIEAISRRANVSPRTLFNYFDSKEDVLLGLHTIEAGDDIIETCALEHRGSNTTEAVISLMIQLIGPRLTDHKLFKTRRQLISKYPALLERQMSRIAQVNKRLVKVVQQLTELNGRTTLSDDEAEILLALCSSSVRVVIHKWACTNRKASLDKLEKEAITKVNEVLAKIQ